jgi:hypothetical protein
MQCPLSLLNGLTGPVTDMLVETGKVIENHAFSNIRVSR